MRLKNSRKLQKKIVFDLKTNRRTTAHFWKLFFALYGQLKIGKNSYLSDNFKIFVIQPVRSLGIYETLDFQDEFSILRFIYPLIK